MLAKFSSIITFLVLANASTFFGQEVWDRTPKGQDEPALLGKASSGDTEAEDRLGLAHEKRLEYQEAANWYRKAADGGNPKAALHLGRLYLSGKGVQRNADQAVKWFVVAAEKGNARAQMSLGYIYYSGLRGVPKDEAKGLTWLRKAVEQGEPIAKLIMGEGYFYGRGVPKDEAEGLRLIRKSAEQGISQAQYLLGIYYKLGRGGLRQNDIESVNWFQKAANQGYSVAQFDLGRMYYEGRGVPQDYIIAYRWALIARALGYNKETELVHSIEDKITPLKVAEAQKQASEWWGAHKNLASKYIAIGEPSLATIDPTETTIPQAETKVQPEPRLPILPSRRRNRSKGGDCESGHWVQSVSQNGEIVTLEDGSIWHINSVDAIDSMLWLPTDEILACAGYLVNTDNNEKVDATKIK